jgi:hypothetical protein
LRRGRTRHGPESHPGEQALAHPRHPATSPQLPPREGPAGVPSLPVGTSTNE